MENHEDLKIFLNVIKKKGYPNSRIDQIADIVDYDLDFFLEEFFDTYGSETTNEFIFKGLQKLLGPDLTYRVDLSDNFNGTPSYVNLSIEPLEYDPDDLTDAIRVSLQTLDSKIFDNGVEKTFEEMESEVDFSEWSDWGEFEDSIFHQLSDHVRKNLGYWLYT